MPRTWDYLTNREIIEEENAFYKRRLEAGELTYKEKKPQDWTEQDVDQFIAYLKENLP